jgi:hypothetical protein
MIAGLLLANFISLFCFDLSQKAEKGIVTVLLTIAVC